MEHSKSSDKLKLLTDLAEKALPRLQGFSCVKVTLDWKQLDDGGAFLPVATVELKQ